jgi:hypothetical protein
VGAQETRGMVRLAGVNLGSVLGDTRQLSVRRGGSLLLRKAVRDVAECFKKELRPISTGASEGLFLVAPEVDLQGLRGRLVEFLADDPCYRHITFVVDVLSCTPASAAEGAGFPQAKEKLLALNRCRQFQQPTIALPERNQDPEALPCAWDNLRPSVGGILDVRRSECKVAPPKTSLSVAQRHDFGRRRKQSFIQDETGLEKVAVAEDLHGIAHAPAFGNLSDKLAVLYFDGNRFGKIQQGCDTPKQLSDFDRSLQAQRRRFLRTLVARALDDRDFLNEKGQVRLEVLLWGGDECLLVVPAWKGLATLQLFYQESRDWRFDKQPLTHAGGLVFCQVKTPIQEMEALAHDLAEEVKKRTPEANAWDYRVLESIDQPREDAAAFLRRRYGAQLAGQWRPLAPVKDWTPPRALLEEIPRRQVFLLAQAAVRSKTDFDKARNRLSMLRGEKWLKKREAELAGVFPGGGSDPLSSRGLDHGSDQRRDAISSRDGISRGHASPGDRNYDLCPLRWPWLHLAELGDYLAPQAKEA